MRFVSAALVIAACSSRPPAPTSPAPPAQPASPAPPAPEIVAIEDFRVLDFEANDRLIAEYVQEHGQVAVAPHPKRDCGMASVVRERWAGTRVKPCGAFFDSAVRRDRRPRDVEQATAAIRCVAEAIASKQPFVLEQQLPGIDSRLATGLVGVLEANQLVVYALWYDSDPCGGSCHARGGTKVRRCDSIELDDRSRAPCVGLECVRCGGDPKPIEVCACGETM